MRQADVVHWSAFHRSLPRIKHVSRSELKQAEFARRGRRYALDSLPREMQLSAALPSSSFEFVWVPEAPPEAAEAAGDCEQAAEQLPIVQHGRARSPLWPYEPAQAARGHTRCAGYRVLARQRIDAGWLVSSLATGAAHCRDTRAWRTQGIIAGPRAVPAATGAEPRQRLQRAVSQQRVLGLEGRRGAVRRVKLTCRDGYEDPRTALLPRPHLGNHGFRHLWSVFALSAPSPVTACCDHACGARVARPPTPRCGAAAGDGSLVVSAQSGKGAVVRVWDFLARECLAVLCDHASGLSCVDISGDNRAVLAVGLDAHSKQQITLWDTSSVRTTRRADVLLRSTTEYNVRRAKFSAYEPDKFMTVGRDSIRLYRVRRGSLRGLSIQVHPPLALMRTLPHALCNRALPRPSGLDDWW